MKPVFLIMSGIGVAWAGTQLFGQARWRAATRNVRQRLESTRRLPHPTAVDFRELEGLPAPVQRYFRTVLREGQPLISAVTLRHSGTFNMGSQSDRWVPFSSDQRVTAQRPGFDWDARIALFPGVPMRVHDAYMGGEGLLRAAAFGLITVSHMQGAGAIAQGQFLRFLAEAPWYPTALLPSQGVQWEAVNHYSARATLRDGEVVASLLFSFGADGLVTRAEARSRGRMVGAAVVPTPWAGRYRNYAEHAGMQVPLEGEVAWRLPGGDRPYWRGRIEKLHYEFAQP